MAEPFMLALAAICCVFFSMYGYSKISKIWRPKIPPSLYYFLIAAVYTCFGLITICIFKCRYMLLTLLPINAAVMAVIYRTKFHITIFCASAHVFIYAISKTLISSAIDIITGVHLHTFGSESTFLGLTLVMSLSYCAACVIIYIFTKGLDSSISGKINDIEPALSATMKRSTWLLLSFYFIETVSELLPMDTRSMAFYHIALCALIGISFRLMFKYFSAVDNITENSEQHLKERHERKFTYYSGQAKYLEEFRTFRHDYKNRLAGLKALLESGETERAENYLNDVISKFDVMRSNTKTYSDNTLIDAVLQNTALRCQQNGIAFDGAVIVGNELPLSDIDICTVFYNIADNAFEAASKEYEGEKFMSFTTSRRAKWLIVTAENSFDGKILTGKGNEIATRKSDSLSHGLGLKNIRSIVEAIPGAQVKIEPDTENRIFRISVIFPRVQNN